MKQPVLGWLAVGALSVVLGACATPQAPAAVQPDSSADTVNQSLDQMARYFAQAVTDQGLRSEIHDQVARRFDGDSEVLYQTLAASSDVRSRLAAAYSQGLQGQGVAALSAIDKLSNNIPRLQVAVPVHFEAWDAARDTPLVGFAPVGVDDTALKTITAYDAQGRVHTLDARVAPDVPVIILSLNERTDNAGNVLEPFQAPDTASATLTPQGTYQVRVVEATLLDDMEPWILGDAEVMLIAKGPSLYYRGGFLQLNNSGDHAVFNRLLGTTTGDVCFYWYEKDGDDLEVNVTVGPVSLGVKIDSSDDKLGAIQIRNGYFKGGTNNAWDFGNLTMITD